MKRKGSLGLFDLVWLNFVAVASLRWTAAAAASGPSSLSLWLIAAALFFIPEGMAVAELSARFPEEGGLYRWTGKAFGPAHAFLCGWCYWVNNIVFFPSLLLYVSSNLGFSLKWIRPEWNWDNDKAFVVTVTLLALWLVAGLAFLGMRVGKWLQNLGGFGNWIPPAVVSILAIYAYKTRGSANEFNWSTLTPNLKNFESLSFFSQMCFALAGLELVSFLGRDVIDPRKTVTRGLFISAILIALVYFLGTLGLLVAIPKEKISIVNGILVAIQSVASPLHLSWLAYVCGALVALAGTGAVMAWFAGAAQVPYAVGVDKYLPPTFRNLHPKYGTPYVVIAIQVVLATLFTIFATVGSTQMEDTYKVLVDLCLVLYFIPYCYLFLSLFKLRKENSVERGGFRIPGGVPMRITLSIFGLGTTLLAMLTSFFPTGSNIQWLVPLKTLGGTVFMLLLGLLIYRRKHQTSLTNAPSPKLHTVEIQ